MRLIQTGRRLHDGEPASVEARRGSASRACRCSDCFTIALTPYHRAARSPLAHPSTFLVSSNPTPFGLSHIMASVPGPSLGPHHQHIVNRKYQPCPTLLSKYTPDQLVTYCPHCDRFVAVCCECDVRPGKQKRVCHRFRVVYTDGACPNNGEPTATAGVGVAFGPTVDPDRRLSVPVDDDIDSHPTRSSQRAELLAAILALGFIENTAKRSRTGDECLLSPHHASETAQWIVATDSDYLFQGITDWVPNKWMPNGMRTAQGREPANRDLFLGLEISLSVLEEKYNTRVGFWHIPRKMNTIADGLAKAAAEHGTIASRFRMPDRDVETVLVL